MRTEEDSPEAWMTAKSETTSEEIGSVRPHIAVYHTWPDIKNAEYEIILRIADAARMSGVDLSVIDNDGYVLKSTVLPENEHCRLKHGDCDFAISLHFESPKTVDLYSYAAVWNPLDFYFAFGYEQSVDRFLSHNDLLSCGADVADAHALNILVSRRRSPALALPQFFHSVPSTDFKPTLTKDSRVFYVGINWERINNERGRHHDVLVGLDRAGLIDIYGPEVFQGVKPWDGYDGYRGSIPFDGRSLVRRIAKSGICLAFSSAAHQRSGIMSSRLFEALGAGALIIANRHPFIDKYFKDKVHIVDDSAPPETVLGQIVDIVERARANPEQANKMAKNAQDYFLERFSMERCLSKLVELHPTRVAISAPQHTVDCFVKFTSLRISRLTALLDMLTRQSHPVHEVTIILDLQWYEQHRSQIDKLVVSTGLKVKFVPRKLFSYAEDLSGVAWRSMGVGQALRSAIGESTASSFMLVQPEDEFFHDHLSTLVRTLTAVAGQLVASSGVLIENRAADMRMTRRLAYLAPGVHDSLFANQVRYSASHLYRREIVEHVPACAFELLDGEEHNLLNHIGFSLGQLGFSNYASYVYLEHEEARRLQPFIPVEQQHQYIRDTLRTDIRQLSFIRALPLPEVVFASPTGTAIQWDAYRHSRDRTVRVSLGKSYDFTMGGSGLPLLVRGFYGAEPHGVWLDGTFGELEFVVAEAEVLSDRYQLQLELEGRNDSSTKKRQFLTVVANGFTVGETAVEEQWGKYKFELGAEVLDGARNLKLRLLLDHANPIQGKDGEILDQRNLGLRLRSLRLARL